MEDSTSKTQRTDRTVQFQIWLTPQEKKDLRLLAANLDMSMSQTVRYAVEQARKQVQP